MNDIEGAEETPLDPATERVRRKMVRLLAVSVGIMLIGVMAVLAAVVYRVGDTEAVPVADGASVPLELPVGAQVLDASLDDERIMLRVNRGQGAEALLIFERSTGALVSQHPLEAR